MDPSPETRKLVSDPPRGRVNRHSPELGLKLLIRPVDFFVGIGLDGLDDELLENRAAGQWDDAMQGPAPVSSA